ncbi:hypothetical protein DE4587_03826 [Mycobacteroides salmoniphilum]|nr:hypothetical protein DE4586_04288 [Mycobacteroides salmoniphilum]TDZ84899.1 hypothetical protein DE4587_03826 [Mycobacteroides salmoniphilum]
MAEGVENSIALATVQLSGALTESVTGWLTDNPTAGPTNPLRRPSPVVTNNVPAPTEAAITQLVDTIQSFAYCPGRHNIG